MYPNPSTEYPSVYNATSAIWRDAHMLCLAHNLGKWRTGALGQPVWRYRFDLVANNLNSLGASIGTFHGKWSPWVLCKCLIVFQGKIFDS